jgi:hypothetical protein
VTQIRKKTVNSAAQWAQIGYVLFYVTLSFVTHLVSQRFLFRHFNVSILDFCSVEHFKVATRLFNKNSQNLSASIIHSYNQNRMTNLTFPNFQSENYQVGQFGTGLSFFVP